MANGHDRLQSECFLWLWNEHPELRYLCFTTRNNLTSQLDERDARIRMSQMKALGMVRGTTDLVFYYGGRLYGFDIKVGEDRLRREQNEFLEAIGMQGGDGCEIRSLGQFQSQIDSILKKGGLMDG